MRTIKLTLEYDGTGLCGWQRQTNGPTVQGHLEDALAALVGSPTPVIGASRTDAGVHALGQVAQFQIESNIPPHGFLRGLNSHLPPSIAVVAAEDVDASFHARFHSCGKHYRYRILRQPTRAPLENARAWHIATPLDVNAMSRAARHLIGEHDFSAFRASGCTARTTRREVFEIWLTESGPMLEVHVLGNAFLRNMVRIVVGTLADVGSSRIQPDEMIDILASGDRQRAGRTAPAWGLTLVRVFFPPERVSFELPTR